MAVQISPAKGSKPRRRADISLYVRFPAQVMDALDVLVEDERAERGGSSRADVVRSLILEAHRQRVIEKRREAG